MMLAESGHAVTQSHFGVLSVNEGVAMTDISGPRDKPAQRLSETRAEYFERTGFDAPASYVSASAPPAQQAKKSSGIGFSEWMLGLGGAFLFIGGLIVSAAASSAQSSFDGYGVDASLGWQAVGAAFSSLGVAMLLILVSIHAAVSVWRRNRA